MEPVLSTYSVAKNSIAGSGVTAYTLCILLCIQWTIRAKNNIIWAMSWIQGVCIMLSGVYEASKILNIIMYLKQHTRIKQICVNGSVNIDSWIIIL